MNLNDNTTKIITTLISSIGGVLTTGIIVTAFVGQWWVTPKHRAKAISMVVDQYKSKGKINEEGMMTKSDSESLENDLNYVLSGKKGK